MGRIWRKDGREWRALPLPFNALANLSVTAFGAGSESGVALVVRDGVSARRQRAAGSWRGCACWNTATNCSSGKNRLFYSAESTPLVVAFHNAAGSQTPTCPLCRGPIRDGQQAVQVSRMRSLVPPDSGHG